jgi:hypothetical protein
MCPPCENVSRAKGVCKVPAYRSRGGLFCGQQVRKVREKEGEQRSLQVYAGAKWV